jgi:hypothetical protein
MASNGDLESKFKKTLGDANCSNGSSHQGMPHVLLETDSTILVEAL